jgi:hypothetical protein
MVVARFPVFEQAHDIRVVHVAQDIAAPGEPADIRAIRLKLRQKDAEGIMVSVVVDGEIDRSHTALRELSQNFVISKCLSNHGAAKTT